MHVIDKPMFKNPPFISNDIPVLVCLEPYVKAMFDDPMSEQQDANPRVIEFHECE